MMAMSSSMSFGGLGRALALLLIVVAVAQVGCARPSSSVGGVTVGATGRFQLERDREGEGSLPSAVGAPEEWLGLSFSFLTKCFSLTAENNAKVALKSDRDDEGQLDALMEELKGNGDMNVQDLMGSINKIEVRPDVDASTAGEAPLALEALAKELLDPSEASLRDRVTSKVTGFPESKNDALVKEFSEKAYARWRELATAVVAKHESKKTSAHVHLKQGWRPGQKLKMVSGAKGVTLLDDVGTPTESSEDIGAHTGYLIAEYDKEAVHASAQSFYEDTDYWLALIESVNGKPEYLIIKKKDVELEDQPETQPTELAPTKRVSIDGITPILEGTLVGPLDTSGEWSILLDKPGEPFTYIGFSPVLSEDEVKYKDAKSACNKLVNLATHKFEVIPSSPPKVQEDVVELPPVVPLVNPGWATVAQDVSVSADVEENSASGIPALQRGATGNLVAEKSDTIWTVRIKPEGQNPVNVDLPIARFDKATVVYNGPLRPNAEVIVKESGTEHLGVLLHRDSAGDEETTWYVRVFKDQAALSLTHGELPRAILTTRL